MGLGLGVWWAFIFILFTVHRPPHLLNLKLNFYYSSQVFRQGVRGRADEDLRRVVPPGVLQVRQGQVQRHPRLYKGEQQLEVNW